MMHLSSIPEEYLADLLTIDAKSNPHPLKSESLRSSYFDFEHLGLFLDDKLLAYILFQQTEYEAEIIHFVCDKKHQQQGFASKLMNEWVNSQLVDSIGKQLFLEVRSSNKIATSLYLRVGFVEVGRRKGYYINGEDAIVMSLNSRLVG